MLQFPYLSLYLLIPAFSSLDRITTSTYTSTYKSTYLLTSPSIPLRPSIHHYHICLSVWLLSPSNGPCNHSSPPTHIVSCSSERTRHPISCNPANTITWQNLEIITSNNYNIRFMSSCNIRVDGGEKNYLCPWLFNQNICYVLCLNTVTSDVSTWQYFVSSSFSFFTSSYS